MLSTDCPSTGSATGMSPSAERWHTLVCHHCGLKYGSCPGAGNAGTYRKKVMAMHAIKKLTVAGGIVSAGLLGVGVPAANAVEVITVTNTASVDLNGPYVLDGTQIDAEVVERGISQGVYVVVGG